MNKNNLPNNLYELRRRHGLSQEEFAEKLYVSRQAVSKWERGEAYPDTENLIAISDMFGVTIDDLLRSENICEGEPVSEENEDNNDNDSGFKVNVGNKVKVNLTGGITVDDDDTKVKIDFDNGDILVDDEDCKVKVGLGHGGITVDSDDESGNVKVKLSKGHIFINNDDDDDDEIRTATGTIAILYKVPYPIIAALAFFCCGFFFDGWGWAWTFFMTIPIYYSVLTSIRKRYFSSFDYTIFVAFIYCLISVLFKLWHPMWIIFLTIPMYDHLAAWIDYRNGKKRNRRLNTFIIQDSE